MSDLTQNQISDLVGGITALHPKLDSLANLLTTKLNTFSDSEVEEQAIHYWRTQVLRDALIRVRIFVERNFSYIETLGVLSLCRYTFELVVWLKHIEMDERFALFYARRLCNQQIEFYDDLANHLQREINLYCSLAEEESTAHAIVRAAARTASPSNKPAATGRKMADNLRSASNLIDEKLALEFAIYCDQINHNGYDFQVHLIKEQVLPQALACRDQNRDFLSKFDHRWTATISELKVKEWKWKARAAKVEMASEYDFIYSYTSRLLHATPASLTTDHQSLEDKEVVMFLRYIAMQFRWIIRHAEAHVAQLCHH